MSGIINPLGFIKPIPQTDMVIKIEGQDVPFDRLTVYELEAIRERFPILNPIFGGVAPKMTPEEVDAQGEDALKTIVSLAVAKAAGVTDAKSLKAIEDSCRMANPNQIATAGRVVFFASFPEAAGDFGKGLTQAGQAPANRTARRAAAKPKAGSTGRRTSTPRAR